MCGIFFSLCDCAVDFNELICRGPDSFSRRCIAGLMFVGCVLQQQGIELTEQPLIDGNNVLLWNGEDYSNVEGNDGYNLFENLKCSNDLLQTVANIDGPYALVYFNGSKNQVIFGRDVLGRRSLLLGLNENGDIVCITNVKLNGCVHIERWSELPAMGIYRCGVEQTPGGPRLTIPQLILYERYLGYERSELLDAGLSGEIITDRILRSSYQLVGYADKVPDNPVVELERVLSLAVSRRLAAGTMGIRCKRCGVGSDRCEHAKLAVLYSGGVDSAVLAALADRFVPHGEPIDLLNVAFDTGSSDCSKSPDRISGLNGLQELKNINPQRQWNFVEIDVGSAELNAARSQRIKHLIQPCDSVLDDSIGCALWFAGRGQGRIRRDADGEMDEYVSPAKVVLTGIGADEQLAGYSRHRTVYGHSGYSGVELELTMELRRISSRNMGRDDRVLSSHGREARFPFLDFGVVNYLQALPIILKCNLELGRGEGEKRLLRLVARDKLGLHGGSRQHKRAIQFGSRIAKLDRLDRGCSAAAHKSSRL